MPGHPFWSAALTHLSASQKSEGGRLIPSMTRGLPVPRNLQFAQSGPTLVQETGSWDKTLAHVLLMAQLAKPLSPLEVGGVQGKGDQHYPGGHKVIVERRKACAHPAPPPIAVSPQEQEVHDLVQSHSWAREQRTVAGWMSALPEPLLDPTWRQTPGQEAQGATQGCVGIAGSGEKELRF